MSEKHQIDEMIALREGGATYKEIADHFGITRQAAHKRLKEYASGTEAEKQRMREFQRCADVEKLVYYASCTNIPWRKVAEQAGCRETSVRSMAAYHCKRVGVAIVTPRKA